MRFVYYKSAWRDKARETEKGKGARKETAVANEKSCTTATTAVPPPSRGPSPVTRVAFIPFCFCFVSFFISFLFTNNNPSLDSPVHGVRKCQVVRQKAAIPFDDAL